MVFSTPSRTLTTREKELQRYALVKLFQSTNGDNWDPIRKGGWLSDAFDECRWSGVQCNMNGFVSVLLLDRAGLHGTIPNEIRYLKGLNQLFLAGNSLTGTLPDSIGELRGLKYIFLEANMLSGTIPPSLGNLTALQGLWMEHNILSGSLPKSIGYLDQLSSLVLDTNNLTGSLPSSIGNLKLIKRFHLSSNSIDGSLPMEIGGMISIEFLHLNDNKLHGKIPASVSSLKSLQAFNIQNNNLSGTLPTELLVIPNLIQLNIGNNSIIGTIPRPLCGKVNTDFEKAKTVKEQCNLIACPQHTYQPIQGRQYSYIEPCIPCNNGTEAIYLGSINCTKKKYFSFKDKVSSQLLFHERRRTFYMGSIFGITLTIAIMILYKKGNFKKVVRRFNKTRSFVEISSVEPNPAHEKKQSAKPRTYQSFDNSQFIFA